MNNDIYNFLKTLDNLNQNYDTNLLQNLVENNISFNKKIDIVEENYKFETMSDQEKITHFFNYFTDKEKLYFKNTTFKERIEECDLNQIVVRIHKKWGYLKKPIKIVGIDDGIIHVRSISGRGKTYYFYDNDYYLFVKDNLSFREYLEKFLN